MPASSENCKTAGYTALLERYRLAVIPNWHCSYVSNVNTHLVDRTNSGITEVYPNRYWPGDSLGRQLEFALKYDGTNLAILSCIFEAASEAELLHYIQSKPTGKYARRLWFLYEFLTGRTLPVDDLTQGNYIGLLDPEEYYTITPAHKVCRQRIRNNLPGGRCFCPMIRRTEALQNFERADLPGRCRRVLADYSPELLKRALAYLYTRETKSSFEIERIQTSADRTERFVTLLRLASQQDFCNKEQLIYLQNRIVDPRFRDSHYRDDQNYVGETLTWQEEKIHFVSPKPENLNELMSGLLQAHKYMENGNIPAVIHAAVISYGFVFLHPFEDGNGRIHRFLLHNILARRAYTPEGLIFPISAVMLKQRIDYDASLEAFSKSVMPLVEYSLDEEGHMTVHNETVTWYRYIDMTSQAEALFRFIEQTIDTELVRELAFLSNYDQVRASMQAIVDMPDRKIDLFIRFCLQNNGRLSVNKRKQHFDFLNDTELASLENAIQVQYNIQGKNPS